MRQGKQATAMQQDDEALSCAIALQTGLLAVGVGYVPHGQFLWLIYDVKATSSTSAIIPYQITSSTD